MVADVAQDLDIGRRVRLARESAGLTAEELARRASLAAERLDDVESGYPVATVELDRIAEAVALPIDHFLRPNGDLLEVMLRAGDGDTAGIREAVKVLARFTADYEFLLSLEG
jgi:transcriptional regulator with XRE-family HTH domain